MSKELQTMCPDEAFEWCSEEWWRFVCNHCESGIGGGKAASMQLRWIGKCDEANKAAEAIGWVLANARAWYEASK